MSTADVAIRVENLAKMYRVYARPRDMFWEVVTRRPRHKEFWALRDISFEVQRGEVIGVIGRNGAGKSTLLRILAGTLDKTAGEVRIRGRLSAILELGTGFHPEYTGRENAYLGAMCLGMSRQEIDHKIPEIIDFSELGEVIDQPFKTYSSGMQARLTFATAISVDPEILIIDEALATGDMLFTAKCYQRMREIASSGKTVFFVTHGLNTIYELCSAAMLLHQGRMVCFDGPRQVGYEYEHLLSVEREKALAAHPSTKPKVVRLTPPHMVAEGDSPIFVASCRKNWDSPHAGGRKSAQIEEVFIKDSGGNRATTLHFGRTYTTVVRCRLLESCPGANVAFRIQNAFGTTITGDNTLFQEIFIAGEAGDVFEVCFSSRCSLANGSYILGVGMAQPLSLDSPRGQYRVLDEINEAMTLQVVDNTSEAGHFSLGSEIRVVRRPAVDLQDRKHAA